MMLRLFLWRPTDLTESTKIQRQGFDLIPDDVYELHISHIGTIRVFNILFARPIPILKLDRPCVTIPAGVSVVEVPLLADSFLFLNFSREMAKQTPSFCLDFVCIGSERNACFKQSVVTFVAVPAIRQTAVPQQRTLVEIRGIIFTPFFNDLKKGEAKKTDHENSFGFNHEHRHASLLTQVGPASFDVDRQLPTVVFRSFSFVTTSPPYRCRTIVSYVFSAKPFPFWFRAAPSSWTKLSFQIV